LLVISELFWPEGSGGTLATYLITKLLAACDFKIDGVNFIVDGSFKTQYIDTHSYFSKDSNMPIHILVNTECYGL
jgi:hypothetical protein